tara:strand:- start:406 stop:714 length:309 start_codon:yes stop_codon:yes gene_type:complete
MKKTVAKPVLAELVYKFLRNVIEIPESAIDFEKRKPSEDEIRLTNKDATMDLLSIGQVLALGWLLFLLINAQKRILRPDFQPLSIDSNGWQSPLPHVHLMYL